MVVTTVKRWAMKAAMAERRLADADDRDGGHGAGGIEAGVVEAGDDRRVGAAALARGDLDQQAGHGQRLVVIALDRGRPHGRGDGDDLGAGGGDAARGRGDRRRSCSRSCWD